MANTVETDFRVNLSQSELNKVERYKATISDLEKTSSGLSNSAETATNKIAAGFDKAKVSVENFDKTARAATPHIPTISKFWQNEAEKVDASVKQIEQAENNLAKRSGYRSLAFTIDDAGNITDRVNRPKNNGYKYDPSKPSPNEFGFKVDYNDSETIAGAKRVKDSIEKIGEASEKTAAKLNLIRGFGPVFRELGLGINETELNVAIVGVNKLNEYLAKNAAAKAATTTASATLTVTEGAATAATTAATTAQAGLAATTATATTAIAAEGATATASGAATAAAFASVGAVLATVAVPLTALAAGAAVVYHITGDIRSEAERRLKVEEKIADVYGKQYSLQLQLTREFAVQRANAERADNFAQFVKTDSIEQLTSRRDTLLKLIAASPTRISPVGAPDTETDKYFANEVENMKREESAIEQRLREIPRQTSKAADDNFNQSFINFEKSQNDRLDSEKRYQAKLKEYNDKREAEAKKAAEKLKDEIEKTATTIQNIYQKANSQNPFVAVFADADRAAKTLKDTIKSLSPEMQKQAQAMQKSVDDLALFNARLDNNLGTLDLKERIDELKNFKPKFDQSQADEIARRNVSYAGYTPGGTYGSFLSNKAGGFDKLTDAQKRDIYQVSLLSQPSFTNNKPDAFTDSNRRALISAFAGEQLRAQKTDENLSIQQKLDKQLAVIDSLKAKTPEERVAADRRALSISANIRPEQITDVERNKLILVAERESARRDAAEARANQLREQQVEHLKAIRDHQQKTGGGSGDVTVTVKDRTSGGIDTETNPLVPAPNTNDTARHYYDPDLNYDYGKGKGGFSNK